MLFRSPNPAGELPISTPNHRAIAARHCLANHRSTHLEHLHRLLQPFNVRGPWALTQFAGMGNLDVQVWKGLLKRNICMSFPMLQTGWDDDVEYLHVGGVCVKRVLLILSRIAATPFGPSGNELKKHRRTFEHRRQVGCNWRCYWEPNFHHLVACRNTKAWLKSPREDRS